ncbi:hypothetical protein ACIBKX_32940 [Streptomyces sp. NPDC050658]|uniref:hypothetical protein n=1 Tax=unclassified Streptomyces TaxID=2593676 RepID=UPI00342B456A
MFSGSEAASAVQRPMHRPVTAPPVPPETEFPFRLPRGFVDAEGQLHRDGVMRLATARDELLPLKDQRVQENPAYLSVVLLGRVVTRLGDLPEVHAGVVEGLFAADLAFLQRFYEKINTDGTAAASTICPACTHEFPVDLGSRLGE